MSELPNTVQNRLKLLSEVNARLGALIQFNLDHPGHWTPIEVEDYDTLRIAWSNAVDALSSFENGREAG
jgi:hypothetical protein